jgi:RHS repeat-associated protein
MRLAPGDRRKAKNLGFARLSGNLVTDVLEFVKSPYETRVWLNYPGQTSSSIATGITINSPSVIGRVIDDGSTQLHKTSYTARGRVSETTDPLGRKVAYTYDASGYNLIEARMTTAGSSELLMSATYTAQNLPLDTFDANGQKTSYTYNSFGQPLTITLPQRAGQPTEKIQYTYNAQGFLTKITDPLGGTTDFTYDAYGRVQTVKDRDTYTMKLDYDNLDRITKLTFPDGTFTQTNYNRLDTEWTRDREGRWTRMWYNDLRQMVAVKDPNGRVSGLSWCRCGALASLLDPMGRLTVWNYDLQGRLTSKAFPDGTIVSFSYLPKSGRLLSQTDAKGQVTQYDYFSDNQVKQISYLNAQVATPPVSFTYDGSYGRLASMTDATGLTTYAYGTVPLSKPAPAISGAGQLASIDGPLDNDTITFSYDEWARNIGSSINGFGQTAQIDAIGRVKQLTNGLGAFQYTYVGATNRLDNVVAPNGMKTILTYQTLANDFRLASIRHQTSAAARISENSYQYSAAGRIQQWTQQADNTTATVWSFGYDAVDQLTSARATSGTANGALIKEYGWPYDGLGNRLSERLSTATTNAVGKSSYNNLNQLMSTAGGGRVEIKGQINEPGTVTVNGTAARVNPDKTFVANVDTTTGANTFTVQATDLKGNVTTNQFRLDTTANGLARTLAYDLNGNCTQDGTTTYEWDALNRLVAVNQGANRSEFSYDGIGRRVRIIEKISGSVASDNRYVWLGTTVAEKRDSLGTTVLIRFLGNGEIEGATKRYYTSDHLGSIREVVDQAGTVLVRYDYEMFGVRTRVGGSDATYVCAFGYTGHVHHAPTGMALTWFRAMDPASGRWLSRDPIAESGGINLYAYVLNSPNNFIDPLGLFLGDYMERQRQAVNYNSSDPSRNGNPCSGSDGAPNYGAALVTGLAAAVVWGVVSNVNPLGVLGKATAPLHHLLTNKNFINGNQWSNVFQPILKNANMTFEDARNLVRVPGHKGPHPDAYHEYMYDALMRATRGLAPNSPAYENAVERVLQRAASQANTPGTKIYNWLR